MEGATNTAQRVRFYVSYSLLQGICLDTYLFQNQAKDLAPRLKHIEFEQNLTAKGQQTLERG
ncbi:hypothetical protein TUMSATVNIG1_49260 [Vibrio nigripulchritudo]|nr:hypothetical protein VNTUMSATTG_48900 [Vibrio nigripulchritudo]BDU34317.1 hypothetical protein TUMSATVNIG1_49260 [Vibrio nigripulchritudo]